MFDLTNLGIAIEAPSAEYPFGRLINSNPPGTGNGSPAIAEWANDPLMGFYAALDHFGLTPSDLQEQVGDSDLVRIMQSSFPVGQFIYFGGSIDPSTLDIRALVCDGSTVSDTTYADLLAAIGTNWNTGGEPGGTFRLPDMRGKFLRGWDAGAGVDPARVFGAAQLDQLQGHIHDLYSAIYSGTQADGLSTSRYVTGEFGAHAGNQFYRTGLEGDFVSGPTPDGTNGTPRTGLETRPVNETAYIGIRY